MKKVKNYIAPELAKKKIARYKYWSIKDESGITIVSSDDAQDQSFAELLDKIIADNVDAEVQVKFGTTESSSRQNVPIFIRINETIEWIEPEDDETIKINGVPHKVDKNGNVNINLTTPPVETPVIEANPVDTFRQELELQLAGLRKENELQKQHFNNEMHSKLLEQTLKFKEMMLSEREARLAEREQQLAQQEANLEERQQEMSNDVKGYLRNIPNALGGLVKEWMQKTPTKQPLGTTETAPKPRRKVAFDFDEEDAQMEIDDYETFEENVEETNNEPITTQKNEDHADIQSETNSTST